MNQRGVILITCYMVIAALSAFGVAFLTRSISERSVASKYYDSTQAFWHAEAGVNKALWVINNNLDKINDNTELTRLAMLDNNGEFDVQISGASAARKTITVGGTFASITRGITTDANNDWQRKIPGAVYSRGVVQVKFDARDTAYINGGVKPGIYSTDDVKTKKIGEGRIVGTPQGVLENQPLPNDLKDGIWDTFDFNNLREMAKADGTYFSANDDDGAENNNAYNKSGKYTLPVTPGQTNGVFFFDAKRGEPLDDDEVSPRNKVKVTLKGTTEPMSGILVVVGDLNIKDTNDLDFQFEGIVLVLDNLKLTDGKHHRRSGTNDSDIFIKGAVLSENIIQNGRHRKKKATLDIDNATIEYSPESMAKTPSRWSVDPGTWRES